MLDDEHRILQRQRGVHQADVVGGGRRRDDPPARAGREDARRGPSGAGSRSRSPSRPWCAARSGTGLSPPNMCRALPIWLNTWSAATHMKSGYMNSTTGRNRPSSASPPPRPAKAFSLIGVPTNAVLAVLRQALGRAVRAAAEPVHVLAEHDDALVAGHPAVHHAGHGVDEFHCDAKARRARSARATVSDRVRSRRRARRR